MEAKNARAELVREVLSSIRSIKLYGWERHFDKKIHESRKLEMNMTRHIALSNAAINSLTTLAPCVFAAVSFAVFTFADHGGLNSGTIFPAMAFFTLLSDSIVKIAGALVCFFNANNSFRRLVSYFIAARDLDLASEAVAEVAIPLDGQPAVDIWSVSLGWPSSDGNQSILLREVELHATGPQLVVLEGKVGSGKSSLLRAVCGTILPLTGSIDCKGSIAIVSQSPFLINSTIRDNIIFGRAFIAPQYSLVVKACCLDKDFLSLKSGDQTILSGTEIALSGGQKARIALARAVYGKADIYMLDDPFSAIDSEVQQLMIEHLFGKDGLLGNALCLVTGNSRFLIHKANTVYTILDGCLHQTFRNTADAPHASPDSEDNHTPKHIIEVESIMDSKSPVITTAEEAILSFVAPLDTIDPELGMVSHDPLLSTDANLSYDSGITSEESINTPGETTKVGLFRLLALVKIYGWLVLVGVMSFTYISAMISVNFLRQMAESDSKDSWMRSMIGFSSFSLLQAICSFFMVSLAYHLCLLPMMLAVHDFAAKAIMKSCFAFFDTTPLAQIINRFTNDMNHIDSSLCGNIIRVIMAGIATILTMGLVVWVSPLTLLYILPISIVYLRIATYFIPSYERIRRIEVASRTAILDSLQEARVGGEIIVLLGQTEFFREKHVKSLESTIRAWVPQTVLRLWLTFRLQLLGR